MSKGKFGIHGGQFVPETLMNAINEADPLPKTAAQSADSTRSAVPDRLCRKLLNLFSAFFIVVAAR